MSWWPFAAGAGSVLVLCVFLLWLLDRALLAMEEDHEREVDKQLLDRRELPPSKVTKLGG